MCAKTIAAAAAAGTTKCSCIKSRSNNHDEKQAGEGAKEDGKKGGKTKQTEKDCIIGSEGEDNDNHSRDNDSNAGDVAKPMALNDVFSDGKDDVAMVTTPVESGKEYAYDDNICEVKKRMRL